jgi:hypothetical protein
MCTHQLADFLSQREPERPFDHIADQDLPTLLEPIDDLVRRRNEVSHGVIDDIISTDLLKDRCYFLSSYCEALYQVMVQELLKYQVLCKEVQFLGKPIVVYNDSIACFESNKCDVAVGNILAADTGDPMTPFRFSPIMSIEVNHESFPELHVSENTQFGIKVSFKATDGFNYYVLPDGIV